MSDREKEFKEFDAKCDATYKSLSEPQKMDVVIGQIRITADRNSLTADQVGLIFDAGLVAASVLRPELNPPG